METGSSKGCSPVTIDGLHEETGEVSLPCTSSEDCHGRWEVVNVLKRRDMD